MSNVITLTNVTCSFPSILKPYVPVGKQEHEGKFTCDFLFPPGHPAYAEFQREYRELAIEKWKNRADQIMEQIHGDRKARCYGEGKAKFHQATGKIFDGYEGNFYLTASNRNRPQLADSRGQMVDPLNTMAYQKEADKIYGGCKVNAYISIWLQDSAVGTGVRLNLLGIQFAGDGQRFGGGAPDVSGMFGQVTLPVAEVNEAAPMPTSKYPWDN